MKYLIYAVEDEDNIRELYECALSNDFEVRTFEDAESLFEGLEKEKPDLFLLDIMLPDYDGIRILGDLRKKTEYSDVPIIMVSAKGDEISKVKGLNLGADDYIAKPFGILELIARIKANLRKYKQNNMKCDNVEIDINQHSVKIDGNVIPMSAKEFALIKYLIENSNKVMKREEILNAVWDIDFCCESRTLDMHIKSLREKLQTSNVTIQTIRGVGYILTNGGKEQ